MPLSGRVFIQIANTWIIVYVGGGPTDDKPNVTLKAPANPNEVSSFINIRVADIQSCYEQWRSREHYFFTEPKDHGFEFRCIYATRDGYIIEDRAKQVGATYRHQPSPCLRRAFSLRKHVRGAGQGNGYGKIAQPGPIEHPNAKRRVRRRTSRDHRVPRVAQSLRTAFPLRADRCQSAWRGPLSRCRRPPCRRAASSVRRSRAPRARLARPRLVRLRPGLFDVRTSRMKPEAFKFLRE